MPGSRLPTGTPRQCSPASLVIFRHRGFQATFAALPMRCACMPLRNVGEGPRQSNAGATKRWLMPSAIRLGKGLFVATRGE